MGLYTVRRTAVALSVLFKKFLYQQGTYALIFSADKSVTTRVEGRPFSGCERLDSNPYSCRQN
jgi:hypothetical protein